MKAFHVFLFSCDVEEWKLSVPCVVFLIRLESKDNRVKVAVLAFYSLEKKALERVMNYWCYLKRGLGCGYPQIPLYVLEEIRTKGHLKSQRELWFWEKTLVSVKELDVGLQENVVATDFLENFQWSVSKDWHASWTQAKTCSSVQELELSPKNCISLRKNYFIAFQGNKWKMTSHPTKTVGELLEDKM